VNIKQAALATAIIVAGFFYEEIRSIPIINWLCTDWHWFWFPIVGMSLLSITASIKQTKGTP
jgi:hypothetical protein